LPDFWIVERLLGARKLRNLVNATPTVSVVAYPDGHLSHRSALRAGYLAAALTPDEQPAGETAVDEAHVYREVG
jgi:hypothetical protein